MAEKEHVDASIPDIYLEISSVVLLLGTIIGILVNLIVLSVVYRAYHFHKKPVYMLVLSGSVCSLVFCLTLYPYEALGRIDSFRNLVSGTPLGYIFCQRKVNGYMISVLFPIANWTNVSICYNRYAMCRFGLDTYLRKFSRSGTLRWVRCTWTIPLLYGMVLIGVSLLKAEHDKNNRDSPVEGTMDRPKEHITERVPIITTLTSANGENAFLNLSNENAFLNLSNENAFLNLSNENAFLNLSNENTLLNLFNENTFLNASHGNTFFNLTNEISLFKPSNGTGFPNSFRETAFFNLPNKRNLTKNIVNQTLTPANRKTGTCPFNAHFNIYHEETTWARSMLIFIFTFLANIIRHMFAIYAMVYVLRNVNSMDNPTLVNWTKGTVTFLGIRALLSLPIEITLMLRPQFGISVPVFQYFLMRDLKGILYILDPFIFGLRLPDFRRFLCGGQGAGNPA